MIELQNTPIMLDHALELWENGYNVIPLGDPSTPPSKLCLERAGGDTIKAIDQWPKTPRIAWKQYQNNPADDEQIVAWWQQWPNANIGILTGNIIVVDADSQEAVEFVTNNVTHTPRAVGTGKGVHFYFQADPNNAIRNSANEKAKIDVRGAGGYVVAPPSLHASGKRYEWDLDEGVASDIIDLPVLTPGDIMRINGTVQGVGIQPTHSAENTPPGNLNFDISKVKTAQTETPVAPGGRNVAAASLAGKYIQAGDSVAEALQKLEHWNNQNPAPLDQSELQTTVVSVARTHAANTNVPVNVVPLIPQRTEQPGSMLFTLGAFYENPPPEPEIFWRDAAFFRGARLLIAGGAKKGKSSFAMHLGKAAATGGTFLGHQFTKPLRVVWLQAEIQKNWLKSRFDLMTKNMHHKDLEMLNQNFFASGRLRIDVMNPVQWDNVITELDAVKPDIVIIDPIINFFPSGNENDNAEMHALLSKFDTLEEHLNCAIVALHHTNKSAPEGDPFNAIRGASAIRGWYDTGILLTSKPGSPAGLLTLSYELRNGAAIESHGVTYNQDVGEWRGVLQEQFEAAQKDPGEAAARHLDDDENTNILLNILAKAPNGLIGTQLISHASRRKFRKGNKRDTYGERTLKKMVKDLQNHEKVAYVNEGGSMVYWLKSIYLAGQDE